MRRHFPSLEEQGLHTRVGVGLISSGQLEMNLSIYPHLIIRVPLGTTGQESNPGMT